MRSRLSQDLDRILSRRSALGLIGTSVGGIALAACDSRARAQIASGDSCPITPTEIRGPFPADGTGRRAIDVFDKDGLIRSDIRSGFAGMGGQAEGVRLDCAIRVVDARQQCAPFPGRAVYIWQCDAAGDYSLYNRTDTNYLRGLAACDAEGVARFTTIMPGCYGGRYPHIHLEVFDSLETASGRNALLVSQVALPEAESRASYGVRPEYGQSAANLAQLPLSRDFVFSDGAEGQILALTGNPASGYRGEVTIALEADGAGGFRGKATVGLAY